MKKYLFTSALIVVCFLLVSGTIDLANLFNYENQATPNYVISDNTTVGNSITNAGATLGRVLFYDKKLSIDNTKACASCHLQEFAFGDTARVSIGVNGLTKRHSMRLINARYSEETHAFWNERSSTFEDQATKPIQDNIEMGFSGENGNPNFEDLINLLNATPYYPTLFDYVYGDKNITEDRIQKALAQFVRSIESYDSKFDVGRNQVGNNTSNYPNFTFQENQGKALFFEITPFGGGGCFICHSGGAEFSIISDLQNNGVISVAGSETEFDLNNTKAPTLRDLINPQGLSNGPFMHDGSKNTILDVVNHYNDMFENPNPNNTNLDTRLVETMHYLNLTNNEKLALVAFLKTLTGNNVYTAEKYSNPFDINGNITVIPNTVGIDDYENNLAIKIYPNPTKDSITIDLKQGEYQLFIFDVSGKKIKSILIKNKHSEPIKYLEKGTYFVSIIDLKNNKKYSQTIIKK